jgi:hypothetical protein
MEKASGINNVMQRFGAVFAVAIASSVFSAYGHLGSASAVTDGLRPAIGVSALLSLIGALTALSLKPHTAAPRDRTRGGGGQHRGMTVHP